MAETADDFRILLKTVVDTNDIKNQLKNLTGLKINVDVGKLNLGGINNLPKQAQNIGANVGKELNNSINKNLKGLNNFKINILPQVQDNAKNGFYADQVQQQIERYNRLGLELPNVQSKIDALKVAEQELTAIMSNGSATVEQQQAALNNFNVALKNTSSANSLASSMYMTQDAVDNLINRLQSFLYNNTAMTKDAKQKIFSLITTLQNADKVTKSMGNNAVTTMRSVETEMRMAGKLGDSFFNTMRKGMQKFSYWTSATYIVMQTVRSVKQAVNTVHELDTALVDLRKTTTMSSSQLQEFYYTANDTAKQMGVTTKEIITQASAWSRLGYQTQETATKMAKYSSMFAAISPDMNTEQATDGLVSIMKAFDIGNDNPDDVLDGILSKVNKIGNTAATSNGEIVNMLQKSSSAMKEANNTLEETIALETAAVEITRDDDSVGTAFKTVAMRIRGYDEEGELLDSSEYEQLKGAIADLTKTAKVPGGISLFTDADKTTFKSTYQLLKDISEIYSDLDDQTQAQLLEKLAGKRQGQIIAATINNFKAAEKAMNDMANSAGSAEAEMAVIMDSVDYKANKLKETGTGIAQNLFDRGDMKAVLDFLTSLASILDGITGKLGLFGTVGLGAGLFAGIKNFGIFRTMGAEAQGLSNQLGILGKSFSNIQRDLNNGQGTLFSIFGGTRLNKDDIQAISNYNNAVKSGIPIGQAWRQNMTQTSVVAKQTVVDYKQNKQSLDTLINSQKGATASTIGLTIVSTALNMALTMGVSFAIQGIVKGIDYLIHRNEKLIESANAVADEYRQQTKTLNENINSLQSQKDEFNRLSKGVDDYGNNISLTADEYSRYKEIVAEILGYSPNLISGYDEEGNAIAKKNGLIEESIRLLKEEQRQRLKDITSESNTRTVFKGAKASLNDSEDEYSKNVFLDNVPVRSVRHNRNNEVDVDSTLYTLDHLRSVLKDLTGDGDTNDLEAYLLKYKDVINENLGEIRDGMSESLITNQGTIFGLSGDDIDTFVSWLQNILSNIDTIESKRHGMDDQFMLFAQRAEGYEELSDAQKNFVTEYIKTTGAIVDAEGKTLSADEILKKAHSYSNFANNLANDPNLENARDKINDLFALDKNSTTVDEYVEQYTEIANEILDALGSNITETDKKDLFDKLIGDNNKLAAQYKEVFSQTVSKLNLTDEQEQAFKQFLIDNNVNTKEALTEWLSLVEDTAEEGGSFIEAMQKYWEKSSPTAKDLKAIYDYNEALRENRAILDSYESGDTPKKNGNIDHFNRPVIEWTEEEIEKQRKALEAWGYDLDDFKDEYSTILSGYDEFGANKEFRIAYTPIIDDGSVNGELLTPETLNKYINEVLSKATDENGNVDFDHVLKIDADGFKVDGKAIKNVIGDIALTAESTREDFDALTLSWHEGEQGIYAVRKAENELAKAAKSANTSLALYIDQIHDTNFKDFFNLGDNKTPTTLGNISSALDDVQNAYKTLQSAVQEYNKEGYLSVDTFQSIIGLGGKYLQYLFDENGNLNMNAEALKNVAKARVEEMRVEAINNIVDTVKNIKNETQAEEYLEAQLFNTATAYNTAAEAALGLWVTQAKLRGVKDDTIDSVLDTARSQIENVNKMTDLTKKGIDDGLGMTGESAEDTNKKLEDTQRQIADLDKKANLNTIKHKFDAIEQSVEKLNNTMSLLDNTLDLISEDDHIGKIQTTTLQLDLVRTKAGMLADEFNELQNTEYDSADAANELATRMKSVTDEIATNQKNIIEYGKNIAQYYGDALKAVGALSKTQIDEASNLLDRNIKALEEGGLAGIQFTLSPVATPQSAIEKQRQENKTLEEELQSHYNAVENMQKIALDMQFKETMEDYARQREELVKSLNEIKTTLGNNSTEVQGIESDKNKKVLEAEKKSNQERLTEEKSFSDQSKGAINDLNNWMKTNPIVAPSLDTSAWEGLVTKAESYAQRVKDAFIGAGTVNALNINKDSDISNLARGAFGNGRNALVEAARSQVGYKAGTGKYNKFSEFGVGYGYAYNSAEDWCNDFTSWAAVMAGLDDVIPIGAGTIDTAERFKKNLKSAKNYTPKIGDIAYYGSSDSIGGIYHVEIVSGFDENGKLITIGGNTSGGKVVERVRSDYPKFFGTYYNGTGKFDYDGIAGETYEPEYLIDKKTGKATRVTSPTPVNTKTTDVVGVKQTKELEKHKYAGGTLSQYASTDLGSLDIVKELPKLSVDQIAYLLRTKFSNSSVVKESDAQGIYNAQNSSGISALAILGIGAQESGWGKYPIGNNIWGYGATNDNPSGNAHKYSDMSKGASEFANEFLKDYYNGYGLKSIRSIGSGGGNGNIAYAQDGHGNALSSWRESISQIMSGMVQSLASNGYNDLADISDNVGSIASDTAAIARKDVATRVNEIITGNKQPDAATRESVEDAILAKIQEELPEVEDTTNTLIEKFKALQQVTNEYNDDLEASRQQLLDSVGTDNYNAVRAEIGANAQAKTDAIIAAQVDYELVAVKDNFDRAKEARKLAYEYYDSLVAGNASTEQISAAANVIGEIDKQLQEYSDTYVSTMQKLSETMLKTTTRELKAYDDRISWIDKSNSELERQVQNAASTTEKTELLNKQLANNVEKSRILDEKMAKAHQGNEDLRHDSRYAEIFGTYDTYDWFDAEGNATAKYELDRLTMSPEMVTLLETLFPILQKNTQEWQAAKEESEQIADNTKDINKELAQAKIEVYTDNLERLNEIDEVRKGKQDAITAAMQQQHSLAQSLREEISNINAEIESNMHHEEWLDEDTRKLIFNDEDYEAELKAINDIQAEANDAYLKYKSRIAELGETEWYKEQQITDEYNKRMDVLNEQLQVEKDKLAVKKKELEYNNALKERDTRIIRGGHVVMVANPDTMYNLAKERSQARSDLNNTLLKNSETEQERQSDRISQSINQEIETRNKMVELIGKMSDAEQELFATTLPVIEELEVFKEALSPQNIPWLNSHSRDYRDDFVDMPELYKHGGYNQAHDYAGDYDTIEQLYKAGIISNSVYKAIRQQAENQHNWKRSTDVNTAQYPYTRNYGGVNYGTEYYGINDEDKWAREQAKEYSQLAYEINHGRGTQAQLDLIKELNDNNAKDNKYIANTLDTTLYAVNEDGIVVRDGQKIGLDSDSIQEFTDAVGNRVGEIVKGAVVTADMYRDSKKGEIAHGDYTPRQKVGEIAHGNYNTYASGTEHAKAGKALTDEEGYEFKLKQLGGKFRELEGGEMIFSHPQSANLFEFSQNPPNYIAEQIAKMNGQMASVVTNTDNRKSETHNHYDFGGVVVEHPVDADGLVNGLVQKASSRYDVTKNIRN